MNRVGPVMVALALGACYPTTTRPGFAPMPAAPQTELELPVPQATRAAALALDADSIPVLRTEPLDGWLVSDWFDVATMRATTARPLGDSTVRVRAWVGPSRPNYSRVIIETVYRPYLDPSRAERSLEREVSDSSPIGMRVAAVLRRLTLQYGDSAARAALESPVPPDTSGKAPARGAALPDTSAGAKAPATPPDSTGKAPRPARPDTTAGA
jgi:hypothetical protein